MSMMIDTKSGPFAPTAYLDDAERFRDEVRAWLAAVVPHGWAKKLASEADDKAYVAFQHWWLGELRKAGLATAHWPKAWGGEDLPLPLAVILNEEMARAGAPRPDLFTISLFHLPATLFAYGAEGQRARYLEGARRGEVWCQGFSEPGAGSDLASLRTRAVRQVREDGRTVYVVNGQKVWSSYGMYADYCLLLARTDPGAERKQAGISYFIMDMTAPGVERRPIRQINGEAEFCELFLDDVEIPAENLIGAENDGWAIAQATLAAERGLIIVDLAERMAIHFAAMLARAKAGELSWFADAGHRRAFMRFYAKSAAVRQLTRRMVEEVIADPHMRASPTPSFVKILYSELLHEYSAFLAARDGVQGLAARRRAKGGGDLTDDPFGDYLSSYAWTISGGTNEILRNIIAERVLGLPRG